MFRRHKDETAIVCGVIREVEAVKGPLTPRQVQSALADQGRSVSEDQAQQLLYRARSATR